MCVVYTRLFCKCRLLLTYLLPANAAACVRIAAIPCGLRPRAGSSADRVVEKITQRLSRIKQTYILSSTLQNLQFL